MKQYCTVFSSAERNVDFKRKGGENMNKMQQKTNKFTNEDLKTMQSWDLDRKISVSLARIAEFYSRFPNKIYVLM